MLARLVLPWLLPLSGHAQHVPPAPPPLAQQRVRLDVPFFPDRADQCGPSALASVLSFWGAAADPADLKKEVYRPELKGSLNVDLVLAAQAHGMSAEMLSGGLPELRRELDAGHPVIAFLNVGFAFYPIGHYMVVTGYDDALGGVYAHSGARKDSFVPYPRFLKQWERNELWALLILPSVR